MKPAPFDYYAPATVEEAVNLLEKLEDDDIDAKIIAGGQSLVPMLALRVARPDALIDITKIADLDYIRDEGDVIAIGAMASKSAAEDSTLIQQQQPLFHAATQNIGHRQIRNRGTVGGSFAHADPTAEYGGSAAALGIEMKIVGPDGERVVPYDEFYVTFLTTDIDTTEILTEVRVPKLADGTGWSFNEMVRRDGDLAMAGAAITIRLENGVCADAHIAVFGVNACPARMSAAEQLVNGQAPSESIFAQAGQAAAQEIDEPIADVHASADYRRSLIETLVTRGLAQAVARAR